MELFDEPLHARLQKIMEYVAANTRDQWATDYLLQRLEDLGLDQSKWFKKNSEGHYVRVKK